MRTYWDHSEKERSEMDEEQVRGLLDYELMSKGVLKPVEPKLETVEPIETKMRTLYRIRGAYRDFGLLFESAEDASIVTKLPLYIEDRDYDIGRDFAKKLDDASIVAVEVCDPEMKGGIRQKLVEQHQKEEANRAAAAEYQKQVEAASKATSELWADWRSCQGQARRMERIRDTFADYAKLAEGDQTVAMKFLRKAFGDDEILQAFSWFDMELPVVGKDTASDNF